MKVGKCSATNKDARPCSAQVWKEGLCRWHHPELEAQRTEGRRKGGLARSNRARAHKQLPADPMSDEEVHAWLGVVFTRVIAGAMAPGVGVAAGSIARAMVAVRQAGELEERLSALEARAGIRERRA